MKDPVRPTNLKVTLKLWNRLEVTSAEDGDLGRRLLLESR